MYFCFRYISYLCAHTRGEDCLASSPEPHFTKSRLPYQSPIFIHSPNSDQKKFHQLHHVVRHLPHLLVQQHRHEVLLHGVYLQFAALQVISVCMRYAANCGRQGQVFQTPELQPSPWGQLLVETVRLVGQSWAAEPVAGRQAFLVNLVYSLKGSTKSARVALLCKYRLPAKSFP